MENNTDAIKNNSEVAPDTQEVEVGSEDASAQAQPEIYKELLKLEQEARLKAERDRDNYREGLLSAKRKAKAQENESSDDEESLDDKIARGVQKAIEPLLGATTANKVDSILSSIVEDTSKRELVKFYYENRIQKTGTNEDAIKQDIETALAIADSKRINKENSELKRMQNNNVYVPPAGGSSADRGVVRKAHQWTPEQERALEARAMSSGISDVESFKAKTWQQLQAGTAFAVQPKPKK